MASWLWFLVLVLTSWLVYKLVLAVRRQLSYFSEWGIPHPLELPVLGITHLLFFPVRRHVNELMRVIYDTDPRAKYVGGHVFFSPTIIIRDLELVRTVLVKNFDHFADRKTFVDERVDPLFGLNLNFLNGERWREVRAVLSPSFTSSKMRTMHALMDKCAVGFAEGMLRLHADTEALDIKEVFSYYTNDVIASCAFGIELDTLNQPENEFYRRAKEVTMFKGVTMLKIFLELLFPSLTRKFGMRIVSKQLTDFFMTIVETTMRVREEQGIYRPDMLQLMMEARAQMSPERAARFDLTEMTAQAFFFFLAGFEASAAQSCLIAHELVAHPEVQTRLQAEIDGVMAATGGRPTYEALNTMTYLDAVFSETMRLHPNAFLNRLCSKEFELPPALPGARPFTMKPGMNLMIPVAGIHADPELYQRPGSFEPERFLGRKASTADLSNLGFGLGPRMCIGNRFAVMEIKSLFVHLLAKCTLRPCSKTCLPMVYDKSVFAPSPVGGFWLKLEPRK